MTSGQECLYTVPYYGQGHEVCLVGMEVVNITILAYTGSHILANKNHNIELIHNY